ncbi:hypothetical protein [Streptomyces sp. NRRL S-237]|uniref:hypothetical protein n=1 Tax=Streptomyces sp. NRRL S-237 TaxID=1463895 RepID=UPI000A6CFB27|nr:hypothetical protein [Streptomyces sp. NRRL S-237]
MSFNAAAPDRVLIRLLDHPDAAPYLLARRDLSPAVVDAAVDHPDRRLRGRLTEVPASLRLSAAQWSRLVLGETGGARRQLFLEVAALSGQGLTREAYETLAVDPFGPVREELARMPALPLPLRLALLADPLPGVRAAACLRCRRESPPRRESPAGPGPRPTALRGPGPLAASDPGRQPLPGARLGRRTRRRSRR